MKTPTLLSLIALFVGAAALALTLADFKASGSQNRSLAAGALPQGNKSLVGRIRELAEENRVLRERLGALELEQVPSKVRISAGAGLVSQEEFRAFREEVRRVFEEMRAAPALIGDNPEVLKDQVASALSDLRKEESVGKLRTWQERRLERLDESMPKVETWLGLTSDQSAKLRGAFLAQYDREAELTRRWEAGEDAEMLGEIKRSDRELHLNEVSEFLGPEQLRTYSSYVAKGAKE